MTIGDLQNLLHAFALRSESVLFPLELFYEALRDAVVLHQAILNGVESAYCLLDILG